ncbi:hypothetical protein GOP47_0025451 [Adiantum capillus-veneris]|uniref:Helicase-like transcription factor CHR28 n=1 Tax=Adiantum capillus-veneris TaxID=13818 RepID=A0A9D4U0R9_ADICA|nr:hypothetical protein GOP47_0025451 [Adiantum capillus-veneris]
MNQTIALSLSNFDRDNHDDIDIDIDLFNSIMQEQPPDPGTLPHPHPTPELVPAQVPLCSLEPLEQPSKEALDTGLTLAGFEQVNPNTHDRYLISHSTDSSSDTSSELSDFSFSMHSQTLEEFGSFGFSLEHRIQANSWQGNPDVVDESRSSNTFDDSKSNASCTSNVSLAQRPSNTEMVDLTTDTDSDCEDELIERHQGLAGKRSLPGWSELSDRPLKAVCVRGPPAEEYGYTKGHDVRSLPTLQFLSKIASSVNGAVKLEPGGVSQILYDRPGFKGGIGVPEWDAKTNIDASPAVLYSTNVLQGGTLSKGITSNYSCQISAAKDINRDRILNHGLEGLSSAITEEAFIDEGIMTVPLLRHQRIALAWMEKREKGSECSGGILADDQGLGKTVSTIALILKEKPSNRNSLLDGAAEVSSEEMATVDLEDDDCHPIATGHLKVGCQSEQGLLSNVITGSKGRPSAGTLVVCPTSVLRQWAHELKEKISAEAALSVHLYHGSGRTRDPHELAKHDVVLTTYSIVSLEVPKQPLPDEKEADGRNPAHYSLSNLMGSEERSSTKKKTGKGKKAEGESEKAGPLAQVAWFRVVLDEAQSIKNRRTQAARACWGLRAKRRWCLSGTPIQNTIDDLYSYFRFLKYEPYSVYKHFRSGIKDLITRDPAYGYRNLQLVLRKVLLRRTKQSQIDGEPIITIPDKLVALEQVDFTPEERTFYSTLETQSREQFKMYAEAGTVQSNYVNILWMLLRLRQACNHPRLVKGGHSDIAERSNVECARKLSMEKRMILLSILERNSDACSICSDVPEDAVVTMCSHVFCRQCLSDRLTQDDSASCPYPKCEAFLSSSTVYSCSALKSLVDGGGDLVDPSFGVLAQPGLNPQQEESSKIRAVIKTLKALPSNLLMNGLESSELATLRTEKAIVFSQWTSMLDLLEVSLKKEGFCYRRLDGTMSIQARDRALADFRQLPDVTVIIMSLKAASLGLNMVTASHVLLIDVWWNPTTEDQAVDRAHRIGQTRVVNVSRFTVKNTIEDRILELQERKRKMVASAFGEDSPADQKTRLSMDEMRYLFRV